jgi:hypothetical protein
VVKKSKGKIGMGNQYKYVYGIINGKMTQEIEIPGVDDEKVYPIPYQEISVVVSNINIDTDEIDPTRRNVLAHTNVQSKLLESYDLLPMGFGMIAGSEDEITTILKNNYTGLKNELKRLAEKIEVELKVFWDEKALIEDLEKNNKKFSELKARISKASSPIESRNLAVEAGKLVEEIVGNWKGKHIKNIFNTLRKKSIDAVENKFVGIKNILNASFLVEKKKEPEFKKDVFRLDSEYNGKLNFKYIAPLPPYNFVNFKLEFKK